MLLKLARLIDGLHSHEMVLAVLLLATWRLEQVSSTSSSQDAVHKLPDTNKSFPRRIASFSGLSRSAVQPISFATFSSSLLHR